MHTASPARASLARLPHGPFQHAQPSPAPPLADACRRSSSRVGRPLRRRSARRRRLLRRAPSFPGALTLPAGRGRPCAPPPSLGLLTPPPPRLVDAGSTASCVRRLCGVLCQWGHACTVCCTCVSRVYGLDASARGIMSTLYIHEARLLIPCFCALHASAHYTLCHITPSFPQRGCNTLFSTKKRV